VVQSVKKRIQEAVRSDAAITFVDALTILRALRTCGHTVAQVQEDLIMLHDHTQTTARAKVILGKALEAEFKLHQRETSRAQQTIGAPQHGKTIRGFCGQTLRVELRTHPGYYWSCQSTASALQVESLIGENASAGHESFAVTAREVGTYNIRWVQTQDVRVRAHPSRGSNQPSEFRIEFIAENQS